MGAKTRRIITAVLAVVFLCSTAVVILQTIDKGEAATAYREAQMIALSGKEQAVPLSELRVPEETKPAAPTEWIPAPIDEEDPNMLLMEEINLNALREENPDVVGWIMVPDTRINYPLMQGEDNQYYLEHTWNNQPNAAGSIFLEAANSKDLTDFNTVIYGHNMANMSMFAELHYYTYPRFAQSHPYVYIKTDAGVWRYEVFASYNASVEGTTYGLSFNQEETRQDFLDAALAQSKINTGITPVITDRIITLSTCTGVSYDNRWVVMARLEMIPKE